MNYQFDPLGNVSSRTDNYGRVLDQCIYDAFGLLVGDWGTPNPSYYYGSNWDYVDEIGWGGQWGAYTDVQTSASGQMGLVLLTHRYYDPDTGRFLTRDPSGYEGGVNVYAYTRNNPVMGNDPSGLDPGDGDDLGDYDIPISTMRRDRKGWDQIHNGANTALKGAELLGRLNPISTAVEAGTGRDAISGKKLSEMDRFWAVLITAMPLQGDVLKGLGITKAAAKETRFEFAFLNAHVEKHAVLEYGISEMEYLANALENVARGKSFNFRHGGLNKVGFVQRLGKDSFWFTSTYRNGNKVTILTHIKVNTQYLRNIGITLPRGF
jgi:RHS repeat-associated protein